ncbi:MAG: methyl-accepting chemotaxis protein, partial [Planctomycetes bacterium]|nr:methyl-accepting chemotaxis protein [Planctomycetota bacterium]
MAKISELDRMVADLIRGGPLFARLSREAYDILFVTGREIRAECEVRIADLNNGLATLAQSSVQAAAEKQGYATQLADNLARDTTAAVSQVDTLSNRFVSARQAADDAALQSAGALAATSRRFWYMVVFSGLGVLVAIGIGLLISWRISGPVRHMVQHMSRLADGDLTKDVEPQDMRRNDEIGQLARALQRVIDSDRSEITMATAMAAGDYTRAMPLRSEHDQLGQALAAMLRTTDAALTSVSRAIDEVGDGANAVSDASRSLSQGAQTSAVALEEISQTVNEVDKQTQENAANAREANQLATDSRLAAKRGYGAMTELMAAMGEIQEAGQKIAVVAKLIDDIAFQTNLLSLNAAVEAARAGRQGKGFSVVADKVRNLSGRSAKAARETREMVEAMAKRMEAGAQLAAHTDKEFRDIVAGRGGVQRIDGNR